jgi:hypothetical protein
MSVTEVSQILLNTTQTSTTAATGLSVVGDSAASDLGQKTLPR